MTSDELERKIEDYLTWLKACSDKMPQFSFLHQLLRAPPTHQYNHSQHFARIYDFSHEPGNQIRSLQVTASNFASLQGPPVGGGRLLLLKGYPDVALLRIIAALYNVDPEFLRRHLQFLDVPESGEMIDHHMSSYSLPSFPKHIAQIRLPWLGIQPSTQGGRRMADIRTLRSQVRKDTIRYLQELKHGVGWGPAHTYMRDCELLDERSFIVDQRATTYFAPEDIDRKFWLSEF